MMETRLIPKKFLRLIKNLADENRNYKKIFGNVFWLEVVKKKNYNWFNLRLNSIVDCPELPEIAYVLCRTAFRNINRNDENIQNTAFCVHEK